MNQLPIELSEASGVPFYRQIVDQISTLIRSGKIPPNHQLPSVRDLASHLLVSMITIRRAYSDLENLGLIIRKQGHGTFVTEQLDKTSEALIKKTASDQLVQAVRQSFQSGLTKSEIIKTVDLALEEL